MKPINQYLLSNGLRIAHNPCISPDFCLDWPGLSRSIAGGSALAHPNSEVSTREGLWTLVSDSHGDHAWRLIPSRLLEGPPPMEGGLEIGAVWFFPATFENLIRFKNMLLRSYPASTVFPSTEGNLSRSTLGIGSRFTTLHWPAVFWAMSHLGIGITACQNSIPREVVYDVDVMLQDQLGEVPFPFIGSDVPEGHQGQSVQGLSHGCILENLKSGFHLRGIPWSFNADHQPVGGKYDAREDALVAGSLFASYITFDLSPEISQTTVPDSPSACRRWVQKHVPAAMIKDVKTRLLDLGCPIEVEEFHRILCLVWPALGKMKLRDDKYLRAREEAFVVETGRRYIRELSIDELPGITAPETTAMMLALCESLGIPIHFVAPAFGFAKNLPYEDNDALERLIRSQWEICRRFGVSIGFHSGSGKSQANYRIMGEVTGGHLEIKTSGRYTYEMGVALHASRDPGDQTLWKDWVSFTRELVVCGAFSNVQAEKAAAREFIKMSFASQGLKSPDSLFLDEATCRKHLDKLPANPELTYWCEYNFLYVLAAGGRPDKDALGAHSAEGYRQRSRFYRISAEARLLYWKRVALYITFLAENTGLVPVDRCREVCDSLARYERTEDWLFDISRPFEFR